MGTRAFITGLAGSAIAPLADPEARLGGNAAQSGFELAPIARKALPERRVHGGPVLSLGAQELSLVQANRAGRRRFSSMKYSATATKGTVRKT